MHTLPRQVATRDWATVEKVPKMAMAKSTICFTMVCAASATGPKAAQHQQKAFTPPPCCQAVAQLQQSHGLILSSQLHPNLNTLFLFLARLSAMSTTIWTHPLSYQKRPLPFRHMKTQPR